MKSVKALVTIAGFVAVTAMAAQARLNYRDEQYELRGFDAFNATFEGGAIKFDGSGAPLEIHAKQAGSVMSARRAEGELQRNAQAQSFLASGKLTGGAKVAITDPAGGISNVASELIEYRGTAAEGTLVFPQAAAMTFRSGDDAAGTRNAEISGSSGSVVLALVREAGAAPLKSGELAGPVRFSMLSVVPAGNPRAGTTTVQGDADSLKFNLGPESRTITLSGAVKMSGSSPELAGDLNADQIVISLDASLRIIRLDVTGSPAQTRVRPPSPNP